MKIIISHDVDHLYRRDHYRDLIFVKRAVRAGLEMVKQDISIKEFYYRIRGIFSYQQHHIEDVMKFDKMHHIPSTFFFGMKNGLGMNYSISDASPLVKAVKEKGFSVGVHGVAYNNKKLIIEEHASFEKIFSNSNFGIRMHYVRFDDSTFKYLSEAKYLFDTTEFDKKKGYCLKDPYRVNNMWEFPLCVMDGYLPKKLEEKKEATKVLLKEGEKKGLKYFTILFHDYLYSNAFMTMREWYKWLIDYLRAEGYEFISYENAIEELEKGI